MAKMQNVDFRSVDDFLDYLPDDEKKVVEFLRHLILECLPDCKEKLAYNVPFYSRKRRICYIWPSAVPWGKVHPKGIQLGFCYGNLLEDSMGYLDKRNRKMVYTKTYYRTDEIDVDLIRAYLFEAYDIDNRK